MEENIDFSEMSPDDFELRYRELVQRGAEGILSKEELEIIEEFHTEAEKRTIEALEAFNRR